MRPRRAILYMPGDDRRKIEKAATLGVDSMCMDLEDGVALSRKRSARQVTAAALADEGLRKAFGRSERLARINAVGSGFEQDDLQVVLPAHPDGIVIPKLEYAEQIEYVAQQIGLAEVANGWPLGGIRLLVVVETARGIVNLAQIVAADPRLEALIFGAEDFAGDVGLQRTTAAWEVFYARSAVVTHAAAGGLQAIDMVFVDFRDEVGLQQEAQAGAGLGFAGKQIIHPNQVGAVQNAFTPSPAAIAHAQRVMQAFELHQSVGVGAFALDGKMVDMPILRSAERVLALARQAGLVLPGSPAAITSDVEDKPPPLP